MSLNRLFTYGTLCSGFKNPTAIALHMKSTLIGPAKIKGTLYLINQSYPGLVQKQLDGSWIEGELWEMHEPELMLTTVDEYEGCSINSPEPFEYQRVTREVMVNNSFSTAWVYLYRLPVHRDQEIMSGDFKKTHSTL
jgi:gamma-glutamylcyclotransferase (GGCT)/AIG2-like uncharacterized protein YtfP